MNTNTKLIEQLRQARIEKGLTQRDVGRLTGIKNTTLSNYENGVTNLDIDTVLTLCEAYGLDYTKVLEEAYGSKVQSNDFWIRPSEIDLIKRFRSLSSYDQQTILLLVDRCVGRDDQK